MTPIFVLGLQRSGTTLVANMVAALPQVYGVTADQHRGVHESIYFSHFAQAFGPWEEGTCRARFLDAFLTSDYFLLTGVKDAVAQDLAARATGYAAFFRAVMDQAAAEAGAQAWVEKSPHHTALADDLMAAFPEARFLCVERGLRPLLESRLHGFGRQVVAGPRLWADIIRGVGAILWTRREMRRLAGAEHVLLIRYEDVVGPKAPTVRRAILDHIRLPQVDPDQMNSQFAANSSFDPNRGRARLGPFSVCLMWGAAALFQGLPLGLLRRIHHRRADRRGINWPEWVWTMRPRPGHIAPPRD